MDDKSKPHTYSIGEMVTQAINGLSSMVLSAYMHGKRMGLSNAQREALESLGEDIVTARRRFSDLWVQACEQEDL